MRNILETEVLLAKEAVSFIKRRISAGKTVLGLYALSVYGLEFSRVMRASYLPIRFVDDFLDGDTNVLGDPLVYVKELSEHIASNTLTDTPIQRQLGYALDILESKARLDDNPRRDFVRSINSIVFDYQRASERRTLSAGEIEKYYREAFDPVMDITFLAIDSGFRSRDIPALSYGQGRVYSFRDFGIDWNRGIINVPNEVLSLAELSPTSSLKDVNRNSTVLDWFHDSLQKTKTDLLNVQILLRQSGEKQTQALCNSLILPMLRVISRSKTSINN